MSTPNSALREAAVNIATWRIYNGKGDRVRSILQRIGARRVANLADDELEEFIQGVVGVPLHREEAYLINGETYRVMPTSCRCGGSFAWYKERDTGAWESVGCVCHTLPTGERIINEEMPGSGEYVLLDRASVQALWSALSATIKPVFAHLKKMGLVS